MTARNERCRASHQLTMASRLLGQLPQPVSDTNQGRSMVQDLFKTDHP